MFVGPHYRLNHQANLLGVAQISNAYFPHRPEVCHSSFALE